MPFSTILLTTHLTEVTAADFSWSSSKTSPYGTIGDVLS